MKHITNHIP